MNDTTRRVPGQLPEFPGAVVHSGLIYAAGIVDEVALRGLARSSSEQMNGALDALIGVVESSGGDSASILRIEAYLASPDDLPAWGSAFNERWPKNAPARTTLITQLALSTLTVEIQAIAAVNQ
ncbi:RidA family protein [Curtobacterium sp. ISL-83]|uniref:RidA family protein n=1 Tax=Curtobacterium sp. ISL-83 TaxID=2819145 RepID=UPI001BE8F6EE|nr:RidA family protein [Curtobacterium sp. ISL-83]MBT2504275.1 RidA family protein [Curtobacterium sp. ISL-83]